jgi:hypothetical protein
VVGFVDMVKARGDYWLDITWVSGGDFWLGVVDVCAKDITGDAGEKFWDAIIGDIEFSWVMGDIRVDAQLVVEWVSVVAVSCESLGASGVVADCGIYRELRGIVYFNFLQCGICIVFKYDYERCGDGIAAKFI